jgi:phage gp36-like protein
MSVSGVQYATIDDFLNAGLPTGALASMDKSIWNQALIRASSFADSFLGDKYTLPLTPPYPAALVDAVCQVAAWRLMGLRGYNPAVAGGSADAIIRQGYLDARDWLVRVANGQASLVVVQAVPEAVNPAVVSNCPRGYGDLTGTGQASPFVPGSDNWGT